LHLVSHDLFSELLLLLLLVYFNLDVGETAVGCNPGVL
jgi:hypothetical protein